MIRVLLRLLGRRLRAVRAGAQSRVAEDVRFAHVPHTLTLESEAFVDGGDLPPGPESPPLRWSGVPEDARCLALVVEDVDVPFPRSVAHGVAYGIPPDACALGPGEIPGYRDPAPLPGHGPHRYVFTLLAIDFVPRFDQPPTRTRLLDAVAGHAIALAELTGIRER